MANNVPIIVDDKVHWALYCSRKSGEVVVVCIQWFDVWDYDEAGWIDGQLHDSKEEAEEALREYQTKNPPVLILYGVVVEPEKFNRLAEEVDREWAKHLKPLWDSLQGGVDYNEER